jgi:hypothetical protein
MRATLFLTVAVLTGAIAFVQANQATVQSSKEKIDKARELLAEAKKGLMSDGKYNCCIKDPCDRCALDHGNCNCASEVKAGKAVCPDCYAGWQRGDGNVSGVDAKTVKGIFHSHHHH